uniref:GCN5-like N-acetyltransferase n=1 Tax=Cumathamnion serrulatum TaxID=1206573 RepID=A0A7U1AR11_9FLOR|nr:GCN5-like N-acetyltransferase [Cumathamnion serrulatum]QQY85334.1 GCN5-like N-acetyltransferase [Cumathamnion serrulatum]
MTFWKSFFYNNINNSCTKIIDKENILLIKNLDNKGDLFDIYLNINHDINLYDLEKLCDSVGWVRRPIKKVKIAIQNSFLTACLFYNNNNKKELIGFARATSDESFNATIWDVVIHIKFQDKGLGKLLMSQMIKELRYYDINTITLFADPQVIKFYKHLGFIMDPDAVKGMFWYPI